MRKKLYRASVPVVLLCLSGLAWAGEAASLTNRVPNGSIVTDGSYSDWTAVTPFPADPSGDGIPGQDWRQLWMAHDDTYIYVRLERAPGSLPFGDGYRIAIDTDQDPTTGIKTLGGVTLPIGAEYATNGTNAISRYTPSGCERPGLGFASGWAGDARISFEFKVLRSDFGNPVDFNFTCFGRIGNDEYPDNVNANYFNYTTDAVPSPLPAGMAASRSNAVPDGSIRIDGNTSDWANVTPFPADTEGDGTVSGTDWQQVWVAHDSTYFYFRFDRPFTSKTTFSGDDGESWFTAIDVDKNPSTGWGIGLAGGEFLILGAQVIYDLSTWAKVPQRSDIEAYQGENSQGVGTVSYEGKIARTSIGNPTEFNLAGWGYRSYDWYPGTTSEYFHYSTVAPISPLEPGMVVSLSNPILPGTITIDGSMSDWDSITPYPADAPGDTGSEDWTQVWVAHDDTYFYFRGQRAFNSTRFTGTDGWYWYLMLDTDRNPGTGAGYGCVGFDYLLPGMQSVYKFEANGQLSGDNPHPWDQLSAETWDSGPQTTELKIRRSELGDPAAINLALVGQNKPDLYPDGGGDWFKYVIHDPPASNVVDVAVRSNWLAPGSTIKIDGDASDWASIEPYPVDPAEPILALDFEDYKSFSVAHDDTNVYFLIQANSLNMLGNYGWGYWFLLDTDMNSKTGWTGEFQRPFSIGAEYLIQGGFAANAWDSNACGFTATPATIAWSGDGLTIEVAITRADLGLTSPTAQFRLLGVTWKSYDYLPDGGDVGNAFRYDLTSCQAPFADADRDGDVDQVDFGAFQACYTGSGYTGTLSLQCSCFDLLTGENNDGSIDSVDFDAFKACWSGSTIPTSCR